MTVARDLWKAEAVVGGIEDRLGAVLDKLFGEAAWSDFTTDRTDESIEIFGVPASVTLDEADRAALRALGFKWVWLHSHESKTRQAGQRSFWLGEGAAP